MKRTIPKILKRIPIILGILLGVLLLVQLGIYIYFQNNKGEFSEKISSLLSEKINGELKFADIDISFYKNFPTLSLQLNKVVVTDTLFAQHKLKTIELESAYLKMGARAMLDGNLVVKQLTLTDGKIHLFTDNADYTNLSIFPTDENKDSDQKLQIKKLRLEDVQLFVENRPKRKKFDILFSTLQCQLANKKNNLIIKSKIDAKVKELNFNIDRGGFLVKKNLSGLLNVSVDQDKKVVKIVKSKMTAGGEDIFMAGQFKQEEEDIYFNMSFHAPKGNFNSLLTSLPTFYQSKLDQAQVKNDIDVKAILRGKLNYPDTPSARILISTRNNEIKTEAGTLSKASFDYEFYNFRDSTKSHGDENSYIAFKNLSATWKNIPFKSKKLTIVNLKKPYLRVDLKSQFKSELLSAFTEGTMKLKNGKTRVNVIYKGPLLEKDNRTRSLDGSLVLADADVNYLPYETTFTDCNAQIYFKENDVYFRNVNFKRKQDAISMEGNAQQFLNYLFNDPGKIAIKWNVQAQQLHIENYLSFINRTRQSANTNTAAQLSKVSRKLAEFTDKSAMKLSLKLNNIYYQNFSSERVVAEILLLEHAIAIKNAKMNFRRGTVALAGNISIKDALKKFSVKTKIQNVDIPDLLLACDDFGQKTFCKDNINGKINLDAQLVGKLNKDASLRPKSLSGKLSYDIKKASLVEFEPLQKVKKFILRSRDLANLDIRNLSGQLYMKNGLVNIPLTEVNTSVLNIFMQGDYGINSGTDIDMLIPLRNPKKDEIKAAKGKKINKKRGLKIYLNAKDDASGKVQFSLLKRADRPSFE